jgi:peptidoglycan-N-acetylmuramic acid deacetylase
VVEVLEERNGWLRIGNEDWISGYYTKVLSNSTYGWYFIANNDHKVPEVSRKIDISKYGGYYVGDTSDKKVYLTFDLGYEAGYTSAILDTLSENDVKVVFFVTKYYIDQNPELVKRMVNEGHIVGNHTDTHPSLPSKALNISSFNKELTSTADVYKKLIGQEMLKYMRPPMGEYSELSLYLTQRLGYKSFFWSFAYYDYDLNNQPDETYAFKRITGATHNGAIFLLHGVSRTNTKILDSLIENIKNQGYQFCTIDAL